MSGRRANRSGRRHRPLSWKRLGDGRSRRIGADAALKLYVSEAGARAWFAGTLNLRLRRRVLWSRALARRLRRRPWSGVRERVAVEVSGAWASQRCRGGGRSDTCVPQATPYVKGGTRLPLARGKAGGRGPCAGFAPAFPAASLWSRWPVLLEFICGFLHLFGMRVFS